MIKKRINLLPPEEQKQNALLEINYQVVRLGFTVTATVIALGLSLFVASLFLDNPFDRTESEITANRQVLSRFQKTGLEKKIIELNETMANFNALVNAPIKWSRYLVEFARLLPDEVSIDSLQIDAETRKVEAEGQAETRRAVLDLRQNILGSAYFENINFPLANLEKAADAAWTFRFYLKADAP